jgi:hypothetical protein
MDRLSQTKNQDHVSTNAEHQFRMKKSSYARFDTVSTLYVTEESVSECQEMAGLVEGTINSTK